MGIGCARRSCQTRSGTRHEEAPALLGGVVLDLHRPLEGREPAWLLPGLPDAPLLQVSAGGRSGACERRPDEEGRGVSHLTIRITESRGVEEDTQAGVLEARTHGERGGLLTPTSGSNSLLQKGPRLGNANGKTEVL